MSKLSFSEVPDAQQSKAYEVLVAAFVDDPVERWLYPEMTQYQAHFPNFLATFGGGASNTGTVWSLGDMSAVALWLPPGVEADGDAIGALLTETVSSDKHDDTFAVLEQMAAAHPTYQHWYLPWFGVNPPSQGQGLGGELMARCLAIIDAEHLPTYLETPNPRSIPFYERNGFEVTGIAQSGRCPPITFMLRDAN